MTNLERLTYNDPIKYSKIDIDYCRQLLSQAEQMEQLLRVQENSTAVNRLKDSILDWCPDISLGKELNTKPNTHLSTSFKNQYSKDLVRETKGLTDSQGQKRDIENGGKDSIFSDITDIETCDVICQEAISALEQNEREKQQLLCEIQEERKKYWNERKQLQAEIEQLQKERENAKKSQDECKTEVETLRERLVALHQELEEKRLPSYEQLRKELEKVMGLYKDQNETLQQIREEKAKLLQELEETEASRVALRMKLSNTESDLQLLEKSKTRVDSEYEKLQTQLVELEKQRRKLLMETETTSNQEIDSLRRKLKAQANEKMELIQQLESVREEYQEIKICITQEYEQMKSTNAELAQQHNLTLKQLEEMRNECNQLLQENKNLHKKNEELMYRCKVSEEQLSQLEELQNTKRNAGYEEGNLNGIKRDIRKKCFEKESEAMERERQLFIRDVFALKRAKDELVAQLQQVTSSNLRNENTQESGKCNISAFQKSHYCLEDILPGSSILTKASEPSKIWTQKVKLMSHNMKGNRIRANIQKAFKHTFQQDKSNRKEMKGVVNQEAST
ncbi:uncharacterized protein Gasu_16540 [Galdieria sulphuraria]|uniref:Uncharacterized protein n=1 Tax=Galdieria sulphuraria TaxID=130081 RepID=M2X404_GALSU|nr:uncharacterized protein Gasu_16540 [Galdieria sulphuraria]EME31160.1 hypothetical protein Gasu_16540 [Galdieria sulphuraria]|eukprot:XP_005707680.1 hypothetical protein Gasu_16540 [Galdieria sulphuraria]